MFCPFLEDQNYTFNPSHFPGSGQRYRAFAKPTGTVQTVRHAPSVSLVVPRWTLTYEAILAQIQQLLTPGQATNDNVDQAWKLLFEAAKYRADSQLCNDIADSVYALWQFKSEQTHLATANESIRREAASSKIRIVNLY